MAVHIDQVNVETAGPLSELQLSLGPFNLIYGRNEQGKTFLVEFVIRCLFNNHSGWSLRQTDYRGKLLVSGLSDGPISFMPSSGHKLDDLLLQSEPGLPAQIGRLLVVKGAQLNFDEAQRAGIGRTVLKQLLSGQGLLDEIQKDISKTVRDARVENGQILGHRRGEIRTRERLRDDLQSIDALFDALESTYSGAERRALEVQIRALQQAIEQQEIARRHEAFRHQQKIQQHEQRLQNVPQEALQSLNDDFNALQGLQNRIDRRRVKLADLAEQSRHYDWLEEAILLYEARGAQGKVALSRLYPVAILVALLLAAFSSVMQWALVAVIFILMAAVAGWLMLRRYRSALEHSVDVEEMNKLDVEFRNRFGQSLSGLPQMKTMKKAMEEAYHGARTLRGDLDEEKENVARLQDQIASRLQVLAGRAVAPENWAQAIKKLNQLREQIQEQLNRHQVALAALGVAPGDVHAGPAPVEYSGERLQGLRAEMEQAQAELKEKTGELRNLKQRISEKTGDEITLDWETLIQNLQHKRRELAAEYRSVTAQILAGILVNEQLEAIRTQEEEKIREKLASDVVCRPIFDITRRYSSLSYDDGSVYVADDYGRFPLADLSTGAREQVLLGLRIGFAAHLLRQDRLFLLLDDAFQHADWQRRRWLVDQVVALAQDGWQIVYFTMDDHIRELFNTAGEVYFPEGYRCHELGV